MKQYLMSVYHPEDQELPKADMDAIGDDVNALNIEIRKAGAWVFAGGLHPSSTATTLRVKDGEVLTTDGPFAEGKEHIGGFWASRSPTWTRPSSGAPGPLRRAACRSRF